MESLLKLSGLLNEEDGDRTDLGTLEKRLANRGSSQIGSLTPVASPPGSGRGSQLPLPNDSAHSTPQRDRLPTPGSSMASPAPPARREDEVEALSDMMCSLVTNHCGETKYIGTYVSLRIVVVANHGQGHRPDFPYFLPKAFNG